MSNSIPHQVRFSIYMKSGKRCFYCDGALKWEDFTIDHLQSKSDGGKNKKSNYVCSCRDCNNLKGNMSVEQFEEFINNLHIIMRNNQMWRVFLKHYSVKIRRKTSFIKKFDELKPETIISPIVELR